MSETVIIECMHGLGDNIYQRVIARACLAQGWEVYVRTVWPQLWHDLPVKLLRAETELRTQKENVERYAGQWDKIPERYSRLRPYYGTADFMAGHSIPRALLEHSGFNFGPTDFRYRARHEWIEWAMGVRPKGLFGIVHPSTTRTEWPNSARCCPTHQLQTIIDANKDHEWWEIGYVHPPAETLYGEPLSGVSRSLMHGQLSTEQLIGLMAVADVVVTCVGFMLPLGIALRTPTLSVYGGDIPERLLVEPWMLGAPYASVAPDPFCDCGIKGRHVNGECNKYIPEAALLSAFRTLRFEWRGDHGYYPVHVNGQYGREYFEKYQGYEQTSLGERLNQFRVDYVNRHFPGASILDIGPGSCQFVKATTAYGIDINPFTNDELRRLGRLATEDQRFDVLTFWDSLEHLSAPEEALSHARKGVVVTIPIFQDAAHARRSKHFRPDEHFWYYTHDGFIRFMERHGFRLRDFCRVESELGREDVNTYAFERAD